MSDVPALSHPHLPADLAEALRARGFDRLTPVQEAVLDPALAGRDLRISSQTGSGKTVAIGLAIARVLGDDASAEGESEGEGDGEAPRGGVEAGPRALVLAPTRELAKQVEIELRWLLAARGATVTAVTGGAGYRDELRALRASPHVVVGTPGRMLDHLNRGSLDAKGVRAVVLDEADRMLDMGFRDDIEAIFGHAPEERRTHLVSATFPREVRAMADRAQRDPARIEGTPIGQANQDIEHVLYPIHGDERVAAIVNLLLVKPGAQTLVFARTRAGVAELARELESEGFKVRPLSGEMEQTERNRALQAFKRGTLDALVATDVAARGIDVEDVARVIHAEPPNDADTYTHRSGRTGRAGRKGESAVLVTGRDELQKTQRLLSRARVTARVEAVPTRETILLARDERLLEALLDAPAGADVTEDPASTDEPAVEGAESTAAPTAVDAEADADLALAERVLASSSPARAVARLLARARGSAPDPRMLRPVRGLSGGPSAGPRGAARNDEHPLDAPPPRLGRVPAEARSTRDLLLPRPRREERDPSAWVSFRVTWGEVTGADPRRLLAMACRRGNVSGSDVGSIHVDRTHSILDVAADVAEAFEGATRDPDPRDPRVRIERLAAGEQAPPRGPRAFAPRDGYGQGSGPRPFRPRDDGGAPPRPFRPRDDGGAPPRPFRPRDDGAPPRPFRPRDDGAPPRPFRPRDDGGAPPRPFRPRDDGAPPRPFRPRDGSAPPARPFPPAPARARDDRPQESPPPRADEAPRPTRRRIVDEAPPAARPRTAGKRAPGKPKPPGRS